MPTDTTIAAALTLQVAADPAGTKARLNELIDQMKAVHAAVAAGTKLAAATAVAAKEYAAAWRKDLETVRTERDQMVRELEEVYPTAVAQIIDLLDRIEAVDRKVDHVNGHAPAGITERLHRVEREARGRLEQPDAPLSQGLQLPRLHRRQGEAIMAYPPPAPSFAAGILVPQAGIYGSDWPELLDKRDAELQQEGKGSLEFYDRREAEAKERRERELREAKA
jgi:hypothetical protein